MLIGLKRRNSLSWKEAKSGGSRFFWAWIAYQTVKGTLTTSLIWLPLIMSYWGN